VRRATREDKLLGSGERFGRVEVELTALDLSYWCNGYRGHYQRSRKEAARQARRLFPIASLDVVS
jgi:hypothetical protein